MAKVTLFSTYEPLSRPARIPPSRLLI